MKRILAVISFLFGIACIVFSVSQGLDAADDDVQSRLKSAQDKIYRSEFDAAAEDYRKVLAQDANNAEACSGLGVIAAKKDNDAEAGNYFRRAASLDPNNSAAYTGLGNIAFKKGNLDEALGLFKKAVSLDDKSSKAYEGLLRTYAAYKDKDCKAEIFGTQMALEKIDPELAGRLSEELGLGGVKKGETEEERLKKLQEKQLGQQQEQQLKEAPKPAG